MQRSRGRNGVIAESRFFAAYALLILSAVVLSASAVWVSKQPLFQEMPSPGEITPLNAATLPEKKNIAYYDSILQRGELFVAQKGIPV
ncbi:MAG: hypothetical protein NC924_06075, partial [Candidatus Omnitrophica bacterium]|nr:hypothetical protein [Candidatus Omnitrophota bacterium]